MRRRPNKPCDDPCRWHQEERMAQVYSIEHFVNGTRAPGRSGRTAPVFNPATGEQTGAVALASRDEVDAAVAGARAAFPGWAATTPLRRARILNKFLGIL